MTTYVKNRGSLLWKANIGPSIAWWTVRIDAYLKKLPDGSYEDDTADVRARHKLLADALHDPMKSFEMLRKVGVTFYPYQRWCIWFTRHRLPWLSQFIILLHLRFKK